MNSRALRKGHTGGGILSGRMCFETSWGENLGNEAGEENVIFGWNFDP